MFIPGVDLKQPYRTRKVNQPPQFTNFKPRGIPKKYLKRTELYIDEFEAIRLADYCGMDHQQAAEQMQISRPTFTRLIKKARQKIATMLNEGMELIISGGNFELLNTLYHCRDCGETTRIPLYLKSDNCLECGSENVDDLAEKLKNK
jgi:uncharacterized protein